jgi:hypothetical protein
MSTTTDGTQLSPCVELFIELLLDGASTVTLARCEVDGVKSENCPPYIRNGWKEKKIEGGINATAARLSFSQSEIRMRGK